MPLLQGLLALRKELGINSRSKLEILCADNDMYVARIDDKLTVKLGPSKWEAVARHVCAPGACQNNVLALTHTPMVSCICSHSLSYVSLLMPCG
jgi:hypothetical protein